MSVFLTPELEPFYGGTYYPPREMYGRPSFTTVLERIDQFWREEKERARESGRELIAMLDEQEQDPSHTAAEPLDPMMLDTAYRAIASGYDTVNAGFGNGAKFPRPVVFTFLFRYFRSTRTSEALRMALTSLMAMASGGMYDHIGGGFHRYSVDPVWRVPHFEKMLYDQAQLITSFVDAYVLTRDEFFARIARETIEYVLREMRSDEGGFYSAEDADSLPPEDGSGRASGGEKKEGAFYLWSRSEIERILSADEAKIFCAYYSIGKEGNVPNDPHGEFAGMNILYAPLTLEQAAAACSMSAVEASAHLEGAREKLFDVRAQRPHPFLDDKIIASWNGLMIGALARASVALAEERYKQAAIRAADFLIESLYDSEAKTLRRVSRKGEVSGQAQLEDYACVIEAMLELSAIDPAREQWLTLAHTLAGTQEALFWDAAEGGYYETSGKDPSVLVKMKDAYDGAEPSGNAVSAMNLVHLARLTSKPSYQLQCVKTLRASCARIRETPQAMPLLLCALDVWLSNDAYICTADGCAWMPTSTIPQ